jgi:type IV protein arginine methyltransferase
MADASEEIHVNIGIQETLLAASQHNIPRLRQLIRSSNNIENPVNVKDPETGYTPLHAAIAACEQDSSDSKDSAPNGRHSDDIDGTVSEQERIQQTGRDTVKFLLQEGAIWNDLDENNESAGCLARRLGLTELYELMVDAGVRAELLLSHLEGYEQLSDHDAEEDCNEIQAQEKPEGLSSSVTAEDSIESSGISATEPDITSSRYLRSGLTFQCDRLLDEDQNGVMMAWESEIMARTARKLLPSPGLRVLNIGHGMGIVDGSFQEQSPSSHHIVEAHPDVVAEMKRLGWHEKHGVVVHEGKWQEILPKLIEQNETFDAIYYDTFAESYSDFRSFFSEQVIGLLDQTAGKWGFFNGMGADRQISYDVYQKVVEIDLFEAGYDVEWEDIKVPQLEGEWAGVRRRYWVIDNYRLPICKYTSE